jgi:hypothetical protein
MKELHDIRPAVMYSFFYVRMALITDTVAKDGGERVGIADR